MASPSKNIFISYARKDKDVVLEIYNFLYRAKIKPWIDVHDILPGEDWQRAINIAIQNSIAFLAIISENSYNKRGVLQKEILLALDQWDKLLPDDIFLIPVRIDESPLPERLSKFQAVDWFAVDGREKLVRSIKKIIAHRSS